MGWVALVVTWLALAGVARAGQITVNTFNDQGPLPGECSGGPADCTLRQAIDKANAASSPTTINVPAGTYTLSIPPSGPNDNSTGDLNIANPSASITVVGQTDANGVPITIVQGGTSMATGIDRVLSVAAGATAAISNLQIQFGKAAGVASGGGIFDNGNLTLSNDVITQNTSGPTPGSLRGGGGLDVEGSASITNSTISANVASPNNGGGVRFGGTAGSALTITGSSITGNAANGSGGGGVALDAATAQGAATISGSSITGNHAAAGGGLTMQVRGTLNITGTVISGNATTGIGAGIAENGDGQTLNITQSTIHGNTASQEGGGIENNGANALNVTQSTIDGNTAQYGGAVAEEGGDPTSPSTAPAVSLTNDTITNNRAVGPTGFKVGGGGLDGDGGGTFVLVNTTLTNNSSTVAQGGNISSAGTDIFDLSNSIVAGGSPANCQTFGGTQVFFSSATHGRGTANGHNLSDDSTCTLASANGDLFPANPLLGPLQNNGGPTQTMALMPGSPAIDAGNDAACPPTDQRGVTRPQGPHCDIGAYEFATAVQGPPAGPGPPANPGPPVNTVPPRITGTPLPDHTVRCSTGSWANNPTAFRFQWTSNVMPVLGATSTTYKVRVADRGATLTCSVTASNAAGSATATSAGVLVAVPGTLTCPRPRGRMTTSREGPLSLGESRTAARRALKRFTKHNNQDDFCLFAGWGIRAFYPSSKTLSLAGGDQRLTGRIVIALSANPFYGFHGVRPGTSFKVAKRMLRLGRVHHIGLNDWYFNAEGNVLVKVRQRTILEIGPADPRFTHGYKMQQKFMTTFGSF